MKILNLFLVVFYLTFLFSCKSDEVSDDEYEIINLLTSQIKHPFPRPIPLEENWEKLSEKQLREHEKAFIAKDSIEKSKLNFIIYFDDSLEALDHDFEYKLFEKNIDFDEFYLKKIDEDLMKSKKININKISFPKNIQVRKDYNPDSSKWEKDFWGKYWMSRIIFNDKKTKAVVEFNQICGHHCGGGSKIYFSKINGKWKVVHLFNSWVS